MAILNPNPAMIRIVDSNTAVDPNGTDESVDNRAILAAISDSCVAPVYPYRNTKPKSSMAVDRAERIKNLTPASTAKPSLRSPARATMGNAVVSSATYIVMSSLAPTSSIIPVAEKSVNPRNSPLESLNCCRYCAEAITTAAVAPISKNWKNNVKRSAVNDPKSTESAVLSPIQPNHRFNVKNSGASSPIAAIHTSQLLSPHRSPPFQRSFSTASADMVSRDRTAIAITGDNAQ